MSWDPKKRHCVKSLIYRLVNRTHHTHTLRLSSLWFPKLLTKTCSLFLSTTDIGEDSQQYFGQLHLDGDLTWGQLWTTLFIWIQLPQSTPVDKILPETETQISPLGKLPQSIIPLQFLHLRSALSSPGQASHTAPLQFGGPCGAWQSTHCVWGQHRGLSTKALPGNDLDPKNVCGPAPGA